MRGSTGTPMVVEYAPRKRGVHCKYCKFHILGGKTSPYTCWLKNAPRHYTSVCVCKDIVKDGKTQRLGLQFTDEERVKKEAYAKKHSKPKTKKKGVKKRA